MEPLQSNSGHQGRRRVLTAAWVWFLGLFGSSRLLAAPPDDWADKKKEFELTLLLGRLCLDAAFRNDLFKSKSLDKDALNVLYKDGMLTRSDLIEPIDKVLKASKSPNPVQKAFGKVEEELSNVGIKVGVQGCPKWPC